MAVTNCATKNCLAVPCASRSRGFVLEGFPRTPQEVKYLADRGLFPDAAIMMTVSEDDMTGRMMPPKLDKWHKKRQHLLATRAKKKEKAQKKKVRCEVGLSCFVDRSDKVSFREKVC